MDGADALQCIAGSTFQGKASNTTITLPTPTNHHRNARHNTWYEQVSYSYFRHMSTEMVQADLWGAGA